MEKCQLIGQGARETKEQIEKNERGRKNEGRKRR